MSDNYIEVKQAVKSYRETKALDDVTISFGSGKIHGIIGRNGSGKSVLLKCICGFTPLTSGSIYIDDKPVKGGSCPVEMGAIIETPGFLETRSGYDNLHMLASIRKRLSPDQLRETLEMVGLDPKSRKHVSKYSLGMRQRLAIAQAIMERPPLLILDEPMNGLDRESIKEIRSLLLKLKSEGTTILIASHYAEDIELLCDTVCEMDLGRMVSMNAG